MENSNLDLDLRPLPDEDEWSVLLGSVGGATAFHEWRWLTTMAAVLDHEFIPIAAWRGSKAVGLVPLLVRRRGPLKIVNWLPFPYLGPVVPPTDVTRCLNALSEWRGCRPVVLSQQSFAPTASIPQGSLAPTPFTPTWDWTYIVEAASVDQAWAALRPSARQKVKRSRRLGVVIEPADERSIDPLGAVIAEAFARRRLPPPYPASVGQEIWRAYRGDERARLAVARWRGDVVGVHVSLLREGQAYLWHAGVMRSAQQSGAGVALYWDAIEWSVAQGASLDLVGIPDEGVRKFKEQFGSRSVPYLVARSTPYPGYMLAQAAHARLINLRKSLPRFVHGRGAGQD